MHRQIKNASEALGRMRDQEHQKNMARGGCDSCWYGMCWYKSKPSSGMPATPSKHGSNRGGRWST
jgi:hypothetical protein